MTSVSRTSLSSRSATYPQRQELGRFKSNLDFGQSNRLARSVAFQNTFDRPRPTLSQPISNTNGIINRYCGRTLLRHHEVRHRPLPAVVRACVFTRISTVRFESEWDCGGFGRLAHCVAFQTTLDRVRLDTRLRHTLKIQRNSKYCPLKTPSSKPVRFSHLGTFPESPSRSVVF